MNCVSSFVPLVNLCSQSTQVQLFALRGLLKGALVCGGTGRVTGDSGPVTCDRITALPHLDQLIIQQLPHSYVFKF